MLNIPHTQPSRQGPLRALLSLAVIFSAPGASAQTLQDALQRVLERQPTIESVESDVAEAPRWLAGPPSLAASHLESDQSQGTDETELSLNLPIKSPLQRRNDQQLLTLEPQLQEQARRFRAWYFSGVLRDLYGQQRIASAELPAAEQGAALLGQLEAQLERQVAARAAERFELLAARQARLAADERLVALLRTTEGAQTRFHALTGLRHLPENAGDTAPLPSAPDYEEHPQLLMLELDWQRSLAALKANSPAAAPWTLALVGRELTIPSFSERQLGVSLQLPLGSPAVSAATRSEVQALRRDYTLQRDQILAQLHRNWQDLQARRSALIERSQRGAIMAGEDLSSLLQATRDSRELPIEIKVSRLRSLLAAQAEVSLTQARLAQAEAQLRQLAGNSL